MNEWRIIMEYVIYIPFGFIGFYLAIRLASYAIFQSLKQVFNSNPNTKESSNGKTQKG
jgi:hypothetical protein